MVIEIMIVMIVRVRNGKRKGTPPKKLQRDT